MPRIEMLEARRLLAAAAAPEPSKPELVGSGVVLDAIAGISFHGRVGDFQARSGGLKGSGVLLKTPDPFFRADAS